MMWRERSEGREGELIKEKRAKEELGARKKEREKAEI